MKLISCYIENFGTFRHQSFSFEEGLNVYLEDNGWGKTTLAAFLKAMFYGLEYRIRSKELYERPLYHPWQGGRFGGELVFQTEGLQYRVSRFFGKKASEDEFYLTDCATNKPSLRYSSLLGEELFGIDRDSFERSIFICLSQKAPSMSDSIRSRLGSLLEASGDGESFQDAVRALDRAALRIRAKRGNGGLLGDLEHRRLQLKEQVLSCNDAASQALRLEENISVLHRQILELESRRALLLERMEQAALLAEAQAYKRLCREINARRERLCEVNSLFPDGPPSEEELEQVRERCHRLQLAHINLGQIRELPPPPSPRGNPGAPALTALGGLLALFACVSFFLELFSSPALPASLLLMGLLLLMGGLIWRLLQKSSFSTAVRDYRAAAEREKEKRRELTRACQELEEEIRLFFRRFPDIQKPEGLSDVPRLIASLQGRLYERKHLEEELSSLEKELDREHPARDRLLTDPPSSEEASPSRIRAELAACDDRLKELLSSLTECSDRLEKASLLADQKGDVENELAALEEKVAHLEARHNRILACMEYLSAAKERLSTGYMHSMEESFQAYLSLLDTRSQHKITLDTDLSPYVSQGGRLWKQAYLSRGYSDLVNLCLRLALADAMYRQEVPFLIMDDPFVNLDAAKLTGAKAFLRALAGDRQILYFTCHESRV